MINKNMTYAVVWASNDKNKYWYKVFEDLLKNGYNVIPINPNEEKILEKKCYKNLSSYNKKINFVIFVVPPKVTEQILEEILIINNISPEGGIEQIRMQPWSESKKAISFCKKNKINFITNACIMIEKNNYSNQYWDMTV